MTAFSPQELDERASLISREFDGIFPPYEAFYIQSIAYAASRAQRAFERFDVAHALRDSDVNQVSAAHEALGHSAALSRFFWPSKLGGKASEASRSLKATRATKLREAFALTDDSPLKERRHNPLSNSEA